MHINDDDAINIQTISSMILQQKHTLQTINDNNYYKQKQTVDLNSKSIAVFINTLIINGILYVNNKSIFTTCQ